MLSVVGLVVVAVVAVVAAAADEKELLTFADVVQALVAGDSVRYYVRYGDCLLDGGPSVTAFGGAALEQWTAYADRVTFAAYQLIKNYHRGVPSEWNYNVVNTTLYANGTVLSTARDVFAPDPNKGMAYTELFECDMAKRAVRFFGANRARALPDMDSVLDAIAVGSPLRLVWRPPRCTGGMRGDAHVQYRGTYLRHFEAFDDARIGPLKLSAGDSFLTQRNDTSWVLRKSTYRLEPTKRAVTYAYTDLQPASLDAVDTWQFACAWLGDADTNGVAVFGVNV